MRWRDLLGSSLPVTVPALLVTSRFGPAAVTATPRLCFFFGTFLFVPSVSASPPGSCSGGITFRLVPAALVPTPYSRSLWLRGSGVELCHFPLRGPPRVFRHLLSGASLGTGSHVL
jgi:hypothetical protein